MLKFSKTIRIRDRKYLDWLRGLPCVKCYSIMFNNQMGDYYLKQEFQNDPAHIRLKSNSGIGQKPSDNLAISLCHWHHREEHEGSKTFWGDNLDDVIILAKSLYEVRFDRESAIKIIREAQL